MPLDILPSKIVVFQRDEIRDTYLRDYAIRNLTGSTAPNQQPYIEASVLADTLVPVYANGVTIGNGLAVQTMSSAQIDNELQKLGSQRQAAVGAGGFVIAQGSAGGGLIAFGDEIKLSGLRYQCTQTAVYLPGAFVPIQGVDTGPATNQPFGLTMTWTSPRPGISASAVIAQESNGSGLSGGRDIETDAQAIQRIIALRANPPASGNDAAYQLAIMSAPGLAIQQAFTLPGIAGPGSTGFTFTLRPSVPGQSRIPSAAQLEQVRAFVVGLFPKDDSLLACTLIAQAVPLYFQVTWAATAAGFVDSTTWPLYVPGDPLLVLNTTTPTALGCTVGTTGTSTTAPQVGQTIAFYDIPNATFRRKKILTVTTVVAGVSWTLTFDTTNSASDTSYTPVVGQATSPWSDSLQSLAPPLVGYFDALGPGEQVGAFFDPGFRRRRSPRAPALWPNAVTNRILQPVFALSTVADTTLLSPAVPYAPFVGMPSVASNILTLGGIAAFP